MVWYKQTVFKPSLTGLFLCFEKREQLLSVLLSSRTPYILPLELNDCPLQNCLYRELINAVQRKFQRGVVSGGGPFLDTPH